MLLYRLQNRLPTVVQLDLHTFVVFNQDGARLYPATSTHYINIPASAWALSDSSDEVIKPCGAFLRRNVLVIQATPPAIKRWKEWGKQYWAKLYLMDVWLDTELGALLYAFPGVYHTFG